MSLATDLKSRDDAARSAGVVTADSVAGLTIAVSRDSVMKWSLIGAVMLIDVVLMAWFGLTLPASALLSSVPALAMLSVAALWFCYRGEASFVVSLVSLMQLIVFTFAGGLLSYCVAGFNFPMRDDWLLAFDQTCGIEVGPLMRWAQSHPWLNRALLLAYDSVLHQTALLMVVLSFCNRSAKLREFVTLFVLTIFLCTLGLAFAPAIGPYEAYGYSPSPVQQLFIDDLMALRAGEMSLIVPEQMQGLITCPSFHTIWAILIVWAFRDDRFFRIPLFILNAAVILSTMTLGWHYFADVAAGVAVAVVSIGFLRRIDPWLFDPSGEPRMWVLSRQA